MNALLVLLGGLNLIFGLLGLAPLFVGGFFNCLGAPLLLFGLVFSITRLVKAIKSQNRATIGWPAVAVVLNMCACGLTALGIFLI
jgi:hypothetical protein